jgi:hypothetical protein
MPSAQSVKRLPSLSLPLLVLEEGLEMVRDMVLTRTKMKMSGEQY